MLSCQHLVEFGFRLTVPIPGTAAFEISYSVDDPKGKITYSAHIDVICGVHILLNIPCDVYFALTDVFTLPSIYPQQLVLELRSGL